MKFDRKSGQFSPCSDCPIQKRAVCAYCEKSELVVLDALKTYKTYAPGEMITHAGDELRFVGSIVSGFATLSRTLEDGRRQMVGLLLASDFIGRPSRKEALYDVQAATEVMLCRFERQPFTKILKDMPNVSKRLLEMTMDDLDAAREWMLLLGRKTASEKLASFLVIFARRAFQLQQKTPAGSIDISINMTREAMADYLGLTLETVSRQFSAFRKKDLISLGDKRSVTVLDYAKLAALAGEEPGRLL